MSKVPPPLDLVTIAHRDERVAFSKLCEFYKGGAYWGYTPSIYALVDIINKATSKEMAASSCALRGSKDGIKHNMDVAEALYLCFEKTDSRAARLQTKLHYNFRPNLRMFLPAGGLVRQKGEEFIAVVLPRAEAPSKSEQALLHWLYRQSVAVSPYKSYPVKFLLADKIRRNAGRAALISEDFLPKVVDRDALEIIEGFIKAFDRAEAAGLGEESRRRQRPDDGQRKLL